MRMSKKTGAATETEEMVEHRMEYSKPMGKVFFKPKFTILKDVLNSTGKLVTEDVT